MKIFLDTNIYIIGQLIPDSPEEILLAQLGFYDSVSLLERQVIISQELINQVLRVGKRLKNKDWASQLVAQIWGNLNCLFVPETREMNEEAQQILATQLIPSKDIFIYLTAKYGQADCFVSGNRELLKAIAEFECLTPDDFIQKYLSPSDKTNQ